jgi:hypothetical protein
MQELTFTVNVNDSVDPKQFEIALQSIAKGSSTKLTNGKHPTEFFSESVSEIRLNKTQQTA